MCLALDRGAQNTIHGARRVRGVGAALSRRAPEARRRRRAQLIFVERAPVARTHIDHSQAKDDCHVRRNERSFACDWSMCELRSLVSALCVMPPAVCVSTRMQRPRDEVVTEREQRPHPRPPLFLIYSGNQSSDELINLSSGVTQ